MRSPADHARADTAAGGTTDEVTSIAETSSAGDLPAHSMRASKRTLTLVVALVVAGVVAYGAWPDPPGQLVALRATWPVGAALEEGAGEPSTQPTTGPTAPAASGDAGSVLLEANAPIAQLFVQGRKAMVLVEPVARLQLTLTEHERRGPVTIKAVSPDGRKAKTVVEPSDAQVELRFEGAPKPGARPSPPHGKPTGKTDDPGLAPSPYGDDK